MRSGAGRRATLALTVAVLALGACAQTQAQSGGATAAPSGVPGPAEQDLAPGWDEHGDSVVTPDAELAPADLTAMLRLQATATSSSTSCRPDRVEISLSSVDVAMGHRYGVLEVVNASPVSCSVQGYPGIGARGGWGSTFQLAAEQRDPIDQTAMQDEVVLAPGASAVANVEWTGELAGSDSEPISLLVVQLTADGEVIGHPVSAESTRGREPGTGMVEPDTGIDIGMMTTVRIGPLRAESAVT